MRISSVAVLVTLLALHSSEGQQVGSTNSQQIMSLLSNQAYVQQQIDCVLGKGPCDAIGYQLKRMIPHVLLSNCRSCSPQQAQIAQNVIQFMSQNYPDQFEQIRKMYTTSQ